MQSLPDKMMSEHSEKQSQAAAEREAAAQYQRFLEQQSQLELTDREVDAFAAESVAEKPEEAVAPGETPDTQVGVFSICPVLVLILNVC